jgi:hypothetical protein
VPPSTHARSCAVGARKQAGWRIGMPGRTLVWVIVDPDTGEFSVEGPMTDDGPWN